jgi:hypothetical protein
MDRIDEIKARTAVTTNTDTKDDILYLLSKVENLQRQIANIHKSLDFAEKQRQKARNYVELAVNNGLALGRIAMATGHEFKESRG